MQSDAAFVSVRQAPPNSVLRTIADRHAAFIRHRTSGMRQTAVGRPPAAYAGTRPTAGIWIPILAAEKQSLVVAVVVATPRQQVAAGPPQCAPLGLHVQLLLQPPQRAVRRPVRTAWRGANLPGSPAGCAHRRWSVATAAPATSSSSSSTARATGSHGVYARPRQAGGRLSMNAWMPSIASGWIELRTPTSPTYS